MAEKRKVDQAYIEREYTQAINEYVGAITEEAKQQAMKDMARLEQIATQDYGFEYADQLAKKKEVINK